MDFYDLLDKVSRLENLVAVLTARVADLEKGTYSKWNYPNITCQTAVTTEWPKYSNITMHVGDTHD